MKFILPLGLLLVGSAVGSGVGYVLKPVPAPAAISADHAEEKAHHGTTDDDAHSDNQSELEYIELNNQFVIPVVHGDRVESLVVISLGIELEAGETEAVYTHEPKLRDSMLQVLFDHANIGGFRGRFTDGNNMDVLRMSLTEAARAVLGQSVHGVMITDIARQDV